MIRRTTNEFVLACIAAVALEDILACHGEAFIERAEIQTHCDTDFREALCRVWLDSADYPNGAERIKRACNKSSSE
jgi:hypothetical protein